MSAGDQVGDDNMPDLIEVNDSGTSGACHR
jgi:hypothetical protein